MPAPQRFGRITDPSQLCFVGRQNDRLELVDVSMCAVPATVRRPPTGGQPSTSDAAQAPAPPCYASLVPEPFSPEVAKLFWETDPATIDLGRHGDYVMERVMSRGGWEAMCWLRRTFSRQRLADFLLRK